MHVLIVQPNPNLATLWQRHLERQGAEVDVANTQEQAIHVLQTAQEINVVVLDLVLETGSAFAVADMASYRQPKAKVIFVTDTTFFSDGSIFRHIPNACAFIRAETPPDDLVAIVEHYGIH
jgi:DNA-binding NtrC family response regulator